MLTKKHINLPWRYFLKRKCNFCHKNFRAYKYNIKKGFGKYCSKTCSNRANKLGFKIGHSGFKAMLGKKHSKEAKEKMSIAHKKNPSRYWLGKTFTDEHRERIRKTNIGRKMSKQEKEKRRKLGLFFQKGHKINLGKTFTKRGIYKICSVCQEKFYVALGASNRRVYCSKKCLFASSIYRNAISQRQKGKIVSEEVKEKLSLAFRGPKSFLWMGGKGLITKNLRQHPKYTQWRRRVVKKDGYKCVKCGSKSNLHADHIIPVVENPKLIFKVDNGRTLCGDCHTQITNEWRKSKKLAQTRTG